MFFSKLDMDHTEREMVSDLLSPDKGHERLGVLSRMGCGIRRCLAAGKDSEALGKYNNACPHQESTCRGVGGVSQSHKNTQEMTSESHACQAQEDLGSTKSTLTYKNPPACLPFPSPAIPANAISCCCLKFTVVQK